MGKEREWTQHLIIRSLTSPQRKDINRKIISDISPEFFTSSAYKKAMKLIYEHYSETNSFLTWGELLLNPNLSEKTSTFLRGREIRRKKLRENDDSFVLPIDKEGYKSLIKRSQHDARLSKLFELQNELTTELKENLTPDQLEPLLTLCTDTVSNISNLKTKKGNHFEVTRDSVKNSLKEFYKQVKNNFFLPTGFTAFDSVNLGLPLDSFMLISGKSGTGKSALATQLSINFKRAGARVCFMPLEMSEEQMLLRFASNFLTIPVNELVRNLKIYYKDIVRSITRELVKGEGCFHFYTPDIDETYPDALTRVRDYQYDVTIADYIGLFNQMHPEQSKSLDMSTRFGKLHATKYRSLTIALCQLDDEADRIRYARAMKEHASNAWIWKENLSDILETGSITIKQIKARNQNPCDIKLRCNLACSQYSDYIEDIDNKTGVDDKRNKSLGNGFDTSSDVPD